MQVSRATPRSRWSKPLPKPGRLIGEVPSSTKDLGSALVFRIFLVELLSLQKSKGFAFQSLRVVAYPVEAALQFAGVPAAYLLAGRPHPIAELGHAERRRVHVESLLH